MSDGFPTDAATLHMLAAACRINPDTGRTHLLDFLSMGERVGSSTLIGAGEGTWMGDAPVYGVEFEEGYEPFGPNDVILALVEEILRLREEAP